MKRDHDSMNSASNGFTLIEVVIVALIAGGAMIFILSLGQANVQLSQLNQEGLLARQVALDILDYYALNLTEARYQVARGAAMDSVYRSHAAFRDVLAQSDQMQALFRRMEPQIQLSLNSNLEDPPGSGRFRTGLHCLDCSITWKEGGGRKTSRTLSFSRLVAEVR